MKCSLRAVCFAAMLLTGMAARGGIVSTPWTPLYKGIEHSAGTNSPDGTIPVLQAANCLRIDLLDPDVQFFATPRASNYIANSSETSSTTVSNFLKRYELRAATVANFYNSAQGYDPQSEGVPCQVYGLSISTGQIVSVPEQPDGRVPDSNNRYASILFTTNKTPFLALSNAPPGTNTAGIYTAVTGYYPILTNDVVIGTAALSSAYPDSTMHQRQPRTIYALSADRRYFYMIVIDGRQPGHSEGADDTESALWALHFGASDAVMMDGGGSAAMYVSDCLGNPKALGKSSYIPRYGRERYTGSQLGVWAPPLPNFVQNVSATAGSLEATITWTTIANASSQVEYGTTTNLGMFTPLDSTPKTEHSVTIGGLAPSTRYYFRVLSVAEGQPYASSCAGQSFTTTNFAGGEIFALTNTWRYYTGNLDGMTWQALAFDDSAWPAGRGALWAHSGNPPSSATNNIPNFGTGTRMPLNPTNNYPFMTYYFRTRFVYADSLEGVTLTFTNYVDDGAIVYLNGTEVWRTNMPAGPVSNTTQAPSVVPCGGNATCPMVFSISGDAATNLVVGTNIVAVEVHNFRSTTSPFTPSTDVTFEQSLFYTLPPPPPPPAFFSNVVVLAGETNATFTWQTLSNCTAQIFYGLTPSLDHATEASDTPSSEHAFVVSGLEPLTRYYFRIVCTVETNEFLDESVFVTGTFYQPLLTFADEWLYTTNNVSGENWTDPDADELAWSGPGAALLYLENNLAVSPRTTLLPATASGGPFRTYYFRTRLNVPEIFPGMALVFTNYIDDGAIFYLNGQEIRRVRMPSGPVGYTTLASSCPINSCEATEDVPDVFRLGGEALANLLMPGENVLAVEVHQHGTSSSDIVFGSAIGWVRALAGETKLRVAQSNDVVCVSWDGEYLTLQQATLPGGTSAWSDVPGPVRTSPYCVTNAVGSRFFRLRN